MSRTVMGDFGSRESAERAVAALRAAGVSTSDISVIVERPREESVHRREADDLSGGALSGAGSGAILGGLAGWTLHLGLFDLFGLGRFAARYGTGATVAGTLIGAVLLGLLGAIAGLTFGRETRTVQPADILLTVRGTSAPGERIEQIMRENDALNVQSGDDPATGGGASADAVFRPDAGGSEPTPVGGHAAQGTPMVREGQDVRTLDDEKLGEVGEVSGDYFTVKRGFLHDDLYIPFEQLHEMRGETLYVNAVRDEVQLKGWQDAPLHREHDGGHDPTRP